MIRWVETSYLEAAEVPIPPVLMATLIAFGFVFIHPFEDGNGPLPRYLLHHALIETGLMREGLVFPVCSVILKRTTDYVKALEAYSKPCLSFIKWRATGKINVKFLMKLLILTGIMMLPLMLNSLTNAYLKHSPKHCQTKFRARRI